MPLHDGNAIEETAGLLAKLFEMKELVYFALCRSEEFRVWVDTVLDAEEKTKLEKISTALRHAVMCEDKQSSGTDVNGSRTELFYLELDVNKGMEAYRLLLNELPEGSEEEERCKDYLRKYYKSMLRHLAERQQVLKQYPSGWRALQKGMQENLQCQLSQVRHILRMQQSVMEQLKESHYPLALLASLQNKQQNVAKKIQMLFEKQIASERVAENLNNLHGMQDAAVNMMGDEQSQIKAKEWFVFLLERNNEYRNRLSGNLPFLTWCQDKFQTYLGARALKTSTEIQGCQEQVEMDEMQSNKDRAKEMYAQRMRQEAGMAEQRLFADRQCVHAIYNAACASYAKKEYGSALQGFMLGVKKWHASSFFNAGNMLLRGEGCDKDPGMARYFFVLAYGLEEIAANRLPYVASAGMADMAFLTFRVVDTPENEEMSNELSKIVLDDDVIIKWIFQSRISVMERLFRLGELQVMLLVSREQDIFDSNKDLLGSAIYYFERAYKYIYGVYSRLSILQDSHALDCERSRIKMEALKKGIVEQLDMVEAGQFSDGVLQLLADFYEQYPFKCEVMQNNNVSALKLV